MSYALPIVYTTASSCAENHPTESTDSATCYVQVLPTAVKPLGLGTVLSLLPGDGHCDEMNVPHDVRPQHTRSLSLRLLVLRRSSTPLLEDTYGGWPSLVAGPRLRVVHALVCLLGEDGLHVLSSLLGRGSNHTMACTLSKREDLDHQTIRLRCRCLAPAQSPLFCWRHSPIDAASTDWTLRCA